MLLFVVIMAMTTRSDMIILVGDKATREVSGRWCGTYVGGKKNNGWCLSLDMAGSLVSSFRLLSHSAGENTKNNGSTADNDRRSTATFA